MPTEQRIVWKEPLNAKTGLPDPEGLHHTDWMPSSDIKQYLAERLFIQKFIKTIETKNIYCDHYWLVRRGGYCRVCKKAFNIFSNGFYSTEI